jgi:hypothetical protein
VAVVRQHKDIFMNGKKVYSPTQAAAGAFLGGPIAAAYFIKQNYVALENNDLVKKTLMLGSVIVALLVVTLPFLPENFPNMAIPIATIISTRLLVENFQFKKEDISNNENLDFHSNWRVFFIGLISLVTFMVVAISFIMILEVLGVTSVA